MESGSPDQEIETSDISEDTAFVGTQNGDWTTLIHGTRFATNGKYICGYVDSGQELMQILETYRTLTGTGFSNAQSLTAALKGTEDAIWQQRFMSPGARPRLFWQMNSGEPNILYDGVPFMSVGQNTELPCMHYGGRRKRTQQVALPTGDVVPIDYRAKTGCEAKITVRKILRYPCAGITGDIVTTQGIAAARRIRKQILETLVQKIVAGIAKPSERYYFLLPTPLAHNGHALPDIDPSPPIVQVASDEIVTRLGQGVTSIETLRDHAKRIVDSSLGSDAPHHAGDSAYYPSHHDIFKHVYWLYKTGRVIDQESAFKAKLSLPNGGPDDMLSGIQGNNTKFASDAITSVYSIIIGDGEPSNGLELTDPNIATAKEIEVHSSSHTPDDSPIHQLSTMMGASHSPLSKHTPRSIVISHAPPSHCSTTTTSGGGGNSVSGATSSGLVMEEEDTVLSQARTEVHDMLEIIRNQTCACSNVSALNYLRRQLTELCSQFSLHLAGLPSRSFDSPAIKKQKMM
ncbi:hypothetical protein EMCRGX_G008640 [Ephydatia muelleri]|eukprot:Em0003g43a